MTVSELKALLEKYPDDTEVILFLPNATEGTLNGAHWTINGDMSKTFLDCEFRHSYIPF